MTKYLICKTNKHLTRTHYLATDGKRPYCGRANLIVGERGWKVAEIEPKFDELCWHCFTKKERE